MAKQEQRLTIFVSSTVYGIEELLDQVYALLSGYGYEVWMSHKGTVPVYPNQTAFESCMLAVKRCNLFLGIITPYYGSGVLEGDYSITHQELLRAIELKKPRWILAHDHVSFARALLNDLGFKTKKARAELQLKKKSAVLGDLRVIDMYEAAIRHDIQVYQDRKGNWVQKFSQDQDAHLFVTAQFYRYDDVSRFLEEQLKDQRGIAKRLHEE